MNQNNYVVFDFETTGIDPHSCLPMQLAAVAVDARSLKKIDKWDSDINAGIPYESIDKRAIEVNKISRERYEKAPSIETAWKGFLNFVSKQSSKKLNGWDSPIACGHNIKNYDNIILGRLCKQYGPCHKDGKTVLFNWRHQIDTMDFLFPWFENQLEPASYSFDVLRDYFGLSKKGGHNAVVDTEQCADVIIRFLKFHRQVMIKQNPQFKGAFQDCVA